MKPSALHFKSRISRKKLIDSFGLLLAVVPAAILGNYVARVATKPMSNPLAIYVVGIIIGLLIGILIGIYFKRGWTRFLVHIQQ